MEGSELAIDVRAAQERRVCELSWERKKERDFLNYCANFSFYRLLSDLRFHIAMVRGSLNNLISRSLSLAGKWQHHQLRRLNIHEYQVPIFSSLFTQPLIECEYSFFVYF